MHKEIKCVQTKQTEDHNRATTLVSALKAKNRSLLLAESSSYKIGREMTRAVTSAVDYRDRTTLLQSKLESIVNENKELKNKMLTVTQQRRHGDNKLSELKKKMTETKNKLSQKNKVF